MKILAKYSYAILLGIGILTTYAVAIINSTSAINTNEINKNIPKHEQIDVDRKQKDGSFQENLYTVQLGVFSREIPTASYYNLSTLNVKKTIEGLFKYSSGIFADKNSAEDFIKQLEKKGISNSYVTTFEFTAPKILKEDKPLFKNEMTNIQTKFGDFSTDDKKDVEYKVELGSYGDKVPNEEVIAILQITNKSVDRYKRADGETTYIVGDFHSLKDADNFKRKIRKKGVTSASIIGVFTPN